jgi:thiamine-phosphate diphosphorylase
LRDGLDHRDRLLLYLVLDPDHVTGDAIAVAGAAMRGGITALQLRCKSGTDRSAVELGRALRDLASHHGVLFLINDRIDIALAVEADGVHLGVDDLPLEDARALGGPDFVIGYSPESDEQTTASASRGADYLGVGPVFGTSTKSDAGEAIGLATIERRAALAGIPIIGIGGITASTAASVLDRGACGVAVVSAIAGSPDPEAAARELRAALGR